LAELELKAIGREAENRSSGVDECGKNVLASQTIWDVVDNTVIGKVATICIDSVTCGLCCISEVCERCRPMFIAEIELESGEPIEIDELLLWLWCGLTPCRNIEITLRITIGKL